MKSYPNHLILLIAAILLLHTYVLYGESYRVVRGDTLYSISQKYDISVNDLMTLNNIENPSALSVGMELTIPGTETESSPSWYTVARGDTYYSISRKHGMDVNELLSLNNLTVNDILSIGQKLAVAGTASVPVNTPDPEPTKTPDPDPDPVPKQTKPIVTGPSLVFGNTGRDANKPEWPVTGPLYSVDGDFEGVMIESVPSSYVEAVAEGEVVWAGPYWEFGKIALIESDGYIYFYGGNSDIFVNVGQKISIGTRIGRLENIDGRGNLYFTVFKEGKVIDLAMAGN